MTHEGLHTTQEIADYLELSYGWTRKQIRKWGFKPVKIIGTTKFYTDEQRARMYVMSKKDEQ